MLVIELVLRDATLSGRVAVELEGHHLGPGGEAAVLRVQDAGAEDRPRGVRRVRADLTALPVRHAVLEVRVGVVDPAAVPVPDDDAAAVEVVGHRVEVHRVGGRARVRVVEHALVLEADRADERRAHQAVQRLRGRGRPFEDDDALLEQRRVLVRREAEALEGGIVRRACGSRGRSSAGAPRTTAGAAAARRVRRTRALPRRRDRSATPPTVPSTFFCAASHSRCPATRSTRTNA